MEFQIPAGNAYPSPIIDCFDAMVVIWTIRNGSNAERVNAMLAADIETEAWLAIKYQRGQRQPPDAPQGLISRQRSRRGDLRSLQKQKGTVPSSGLEDSGLEERHR